MKRTNVIVTHQLIDGVWVHTGYPLVDTHRQNFLIVCQYGDWSGFRTLQECLAQVPSWENRVAGFYWIEQR